MSRREQAIRPATSTTNSLSTIIRGRYKPLRLEACSTREAKSRVPPVPCARRHLPVRAGAENPPCGALQAHPATAGRTRKKTREQIRATGPSDNYPRDPENCRT